ncbi:tetratricopeptide repeat protein [Polynucleobacter sp. Adler-ghost]|uniref:tetratricopeptide repeat protein n=1 Tax=Polynucleobacter sp. Adler-ghost TaxID=2770234 RepID=UPI001BFD4A14|nr:tetratricopeptide repeat protein [Polynucleobacter sp. Adler-ghost]QWE31161.1 sel1 repeat family protein [Polynucleobacter sp. Adler-ghost]
MQFDNPRLQAAISNIERGRHDAAFEIFFEVAQNEADEEAAFALTKMCFDGQLSPEQINKLFEWLNSNSRDSNGYANYNVGLMYENGMGEISRNVKTAVKYYEKAIKDEILDAYCNLGNIYVLGTGTDQGVPKDVPKGVELLTIGANGGSRVAAYNLGVLYEHGTSIPQDYDQAFYFLTLATLQKHEHAHRCLIIFEKAIKKDFTKAFEAAQQQFWKIQNMRQLYRAL